MQACVCACVCVCVCVCVCARARARARVCVCVDVDDEFKSCNLVSYGNRIIYNCLFFFRVGTSSAKGRQLRRERRYDESTSLLLALTETLTLCFLNYYVQ